MTGIICAASTMTCPFVPFAKISIDAFLSSPTLILPIETKRPSIAGFAFWSTVASIVSSADFATTGTFVARFGFVEYETRQS